MTATLKTTALQTMRAFVTSQTTDTLIQAAEMVDRKATRTEDERLAYAAIVDELERRTPGATEALDAWCDEAATVRTHTYLQVILDAR
jgi:hypothetical protein